MFGFGKKEETIRVKKDALDKFIEEYDRMIEERAELNRKLDELEHKLNQKCLSDEWAGFKDLKRLEEENKNLKKSLDKVIEQKEAMEKMYLSEIQDLIERIEEKERRIVSYQEIRSNLVKPAESPLNKVTELIKKIDLKA